MSDDYDPPTEMPPAKFGTEDADWESLKISQDVVEALAAYEEACRKEGVCLYHRGSGRTKLKKGKCPVCGFSFPE